MRVACRALFRVLMFWPRNLKYPVDKDLQFFTNQYVHHRSCGAMIL
jgi:hypothetical protein